MLRAVVVIIAWAALGCGAAGNVAQRDVVFAQYTPLASNLEIARRALPPLTYRRMQQTIAEQHLAMAEHAIDLSREKFDVYVPAGPPPAAGYGVVVFISPWEKTTRAQKWRAALDRHGLIFVAAQASGNRHRIIDRRLPLALLGYHNILARYPVDPARVYVWGFSGGSRTAEIAALAYPDVFRGALLSAGSDPIDGSTGTFIPPLDLLRTFQRTRLVFASGQDDNTALDGDAIAQSSLRASCVFDIANRIVHGIGHDAPDGVVVDDLFDLLDERHPPNPAELDRCNAGLTSALAHHVAQANAALDRGDPDAAQKLILSIDARYGGAAAHELAELDDRLARLKHRG